MAADRATDKPKTIRKVAKSRDLRGKRTAGSPPKTPKETEQDILLTDAMSFFCPACGLKEGMILLQHLIDHLVVCQGDHRHFYFLNYGGTHGEMFTDVNECQARFAEYKLQHRKTEAPKEDKDVKSDGKEDNSKCLRVCDVYHPVIQKPNLTVWILCGAVATDNGDSAITRHKHQDHCGYWTPLATGLRDAERGPLTFKEPSKRITRTYIGLLWELAARILSRCNGLTFNEALSLLDVPPYLKIKARNTPSTFTFPPSWSPSRLGKLLSDAGYPVGHQSDSFSEPSSSFQSHSPCLDGYPSDFVFNYRSSTPYAQSAQAGPSSGPYGAFYDNGLLPYQQALYTPEASCSPSIFTQTPLACPETQATAMFGVGETFDQSFYPSLDSYPSQSGVLPNLLDPVAPEALYPATGSTAWPSLFAESSHTGSAYGLQGSYPRNDSPIESICSQSTTPLGTSEQDPFMSLGDQLGYNGVQPSFPSYPNRDHMEYPPLDSIAFSPAFYDSQYTDQNVYPFPY